MQSPVLLETSLGYLIQELQMIWDEVGEDQFEREKVLLDLERECLEVYRRKVDNANASRVHLHQELAHSEARFTHLLLSLGERHLPGLKQPGKLAGTLKEQLDSITPALREMERRKEERISQFQAVQVEIKKISAEIAGQSECNELSADVVVDENDLSLKKLEEYQLELQRLHNDKNERVHKVERYVTSIHKLSATLGTDSSDIITKVHPSLNELHSKSKNLGDSTLAKLDGTLQSLEEEQQKRLEKLHILGKALTNLWNLMDTSIADRKRFSYIFNLTSIPSTKITNPGSLSIDIIHQIEAEVERLDQLKASMMKKIFLQKQIDLEEICNRTHIVVPSQSQMYDIINHINSGEIDHEDLLISMDEQLQRAREEASSRKTIMEKIEKWMLACDEERWLEEYNRDENRYSVSRGAHKNLRRAERARITVNKIPDLVDSLIAKTERWEEERKQTFMYDEVPLLAMLEDYILLRQEKEEENQRQKAKKKVKRQVVNSTRSGLNSSSWLISDRSLNTAFGSTSPSNKNFHRKKSNINSSVTQDMNFIK